MRRIEKPCRVCGTVFVLAHPHQRLCARCQTQCRVEGCLAVPKARGFCGRHLQRVYHYGHPGSAERRVPVNVGAVCQLDGCYLPARTRGWCTRHYQRWLAQGDPGPVAIGWGATSIAHDEET